MGRSRRTPGRRTAAVIAAAAAIALQLASIALGPPAPARAQQTPADEQAGGAQVLYLDSLVSSPQTRWMGFHRYEAGTRFMNGVPYAHTLMSSATNNSQPTAQYSSITFSLSGGYDRFRATLGRDDAEVTYGPGYCNFEVWGDGARLYHSEAVRSASIPVRVDSTSPKRSTPLDVDVPITGVRSLRLVVLYSTAFSQSARYVNRAYGCLWANPRVVRLANGDITGPSNETALHATLRRASLDLLKQLRSAHRDGNPPLRVAVTPLRVDFGFANSPLRHGATEETMRAFVANTLYGFRHRGEPIAAPVGAKEADALAAALGPGAPARFDPASAAAAGRKARADLLVFGSVLPAGQDWTVRLQAVETVHGRVTQSASSIISPDKPTMDVATP